MILNIPFRLWGWDGFNVSLFYDLRHSYIYVFSSSISLMFYLTPHHSIYAIHTRTRTRSYILPLAVGLLSAIFRTVLDWTCSSWSQTCSVGSEVLSHVYQVVFFFLVIVASTKAKQLSEAAARVKKAFDVLLDSGGGGGTNGGGGGGTKTKSDWLRRYISIYIIWKIV